MLVKRAWCTDFFYAFACAYWKQSSKLHLDSETQLTLEGNFYTESVASESDTLKKQETANIMRLMDWSSLANPTYLQLSAKIKSCFLQGEIRMDCFERFVFRSCDIFISIHNEHIVLLVSNSRGKIEKWDRLLKSPWPSRLWVITLSSISDIEPKSLYKSSIFKYFQVFHSSFSKWKNLYTSPPAVPNRASELKQKI